MWSKSLSLLWLVIFAIGCRYQEASPPIHYPVVTTQPDTIAEETAPAVVSDPISPTEKLFIDSGLVNVQSVDSTIQINVIYATEQNFVGMVLYDDGYSKCYLQPDVMEKLAHAQKLLHEKDSTLSLIVFDAARPVAIQKKMWENYKGPGRGIYLSNPKNYSLHNFGAAVDLSIVDNKGKLLDMGCDYDYFGDLARPDKEQQLAVDGLLNKDQIRNRHLLRSVMRNAGFISITSEWWHFNACYKRDAAKKYCLLQ